MPNNESTKESDIDEIRVIEAIEKALSWPRAAGFALSAWDATEALIQINKTVRQYRETHPK